MACRRTSAWRAAAVVLLAMCALGIVGMASAIGFASGGPGPLATPGSLVVGWSWQQPSPQGLDLLDASFVDASRGWSVGAQGTILTSVDGGATWAAQSSGTTVALAAVWFTDALHGCAVGDGGTILHTTNGGVLWSKVPSGTRAKLAGVHFETRRQGWAVGD